jgi:hypothetical protein
MPPVPRDAQQAHVGVGARRSEEEQDAANLAAALQGGTLGDGAARMAKATHMGNQRDGAARAEGAAGGSEFGGDGGGGGGGGGGVGGEGGGGGDDDGGAVSAHEASSPPAAKPRVRSRRGQLVFSGRSMAASINDAVAQAESDVATAHTPWDPTPHPMGPHPQAESDVATGPYLLTHTPWDPTSSHPMGPHPYTPSENDVATAHIVHALSHTASVHHLHHHRCHRCHHIGHHSCSLPRHSSLCVCSSLPLHRCPVLIDAPVGTPAV